MAPLIREFWPNNITAFEEVTKPSFWVELPPIATLRKYHGLPPDAHSDLAEKERDEKFYRERKQQTLKFLEGLLRIGTIARSGSSNTMSQNPTEQNLLAVMSAMNQLATGSGGGGAYSNDTAIAKATGFSLQDVQDYMDILADSHLTSPSNSATGRCAALSAHGRTRLRDSGYNPSPSFGNIIVHGNQGVVMNIGSTLQNVTQTIKHSPSLPQSQKEQLVALVEELKEQLSQVPGENAEDAEAVAETAKVLVENASKEKPNKSLLSISASGLKEAAKSLAAVAPTVFEVAMKIVALTQGGVG